MSNKSPINVVLSGSGALYPIHAGGLHALIDHHFDISQIAGVSGGSIIAAAVASGYKPGPELNQLILNTMPGPNGLIDVAFCPLMGWGLIKGKRIEKELNRYMEPTFGELNIPTRVYAVNVDEKAEFPSNLYTVFGTEETPETSVAAAVRASMSIPGIFQPKTIDGHKYVDGGLVANFPVHSFQDISEPGQPTIGFHLRGEQGIEPVDSLPSYVSNMASIMMANINRRHISEDVWSQTVLIETEKSSMDFGYDRDEAKTLIDIGYQKVQHQIVHGLIG